MLHRSDRPDVHDMIRELTRHSWHVETYNERRGLEIWHGRHRTPVPSLLWQLEHAQPASSGSTGGGGFGSRPAARLEALDVLLLIDHESARWVRRLGEDDPGSTIRCVRLVGSLLGQADNLDRKTIERDVTRWWTSARVATGWDTPAFAPDNTCLACSTRRSLRIRLEDELAFCTECRETWGPDTIGLLAEHIRWENDHPGINLKALDTAGLVDLLLAPLLLDTDDDTLEEEASA